MNELNRSSVIGCPKTESDPVFGQPLSFRFEGDMPRHLNLTAIVLAVLISCVSAQAEDLEVFDVWPGKAPGETGDVGEEQLLPPRENQKPVERLTNVTRPTITVYPAPAEENTGTAVMVCPGGAYHILAMDLEGTEVARWLNSVGVTAFLLKYRVPRRKDREKHEAPLQDAQRAMSLVRSRAKQWNVNPDRIGILGFSAGGHLSAATSTNFDRRSYDAVDDADKTGCRPDFTVLIYPAYLTEGEGLAPEIRVNEKSPPTFFAHANNDPISPVNSARMYLALKKAKVPAELHVYQSGGHGFGLRPTEHASSTWPKSCAAWMKARGLLEK